MRRTIKKTIAAVMAAVTVITGVSAGNMVTAVAAEAEKAEAKVDVVTEYSVGGMTSSGGMFINGVENENGTATYSYYRLLDTAIITLVDSQGNIREIENENDNGSSKFSKANWISGSYYTELYSDDDRMTAMDAKGNYLGGQLTYYDVDSIIAFYEGNGITETITKDTNGNRSYKYQLILKNGMVITLSDDTWSYWYLRIIENLIYVYRYNIDKESHIFDSEGKEVTFEGEISDSYLFGDKVVVECSDNNIVYVCDENGNIEKSFEYTSFYTRGNYLCISTDGKIKVYNTELEEILSISDSYRIQSVSDEGYAIIYDDNSCYDIVGFDGVFWRNSDDLASAYVLDAEKGYYLGSVRTGDNYEKHILSKDKTVDVNIDEKVKEVFGDDYSYYTVSSAVYHFNISDVGVYVYGYDENGERTAGELYVFRAEDNYASLTKIDSTETHIGNSYVKKTENGTYNIYNSNNELIYSAPEENLYNLYSTSYDDYNLLLIVNQDDSYVVIDWNGTILYQSTDSTFCDVTFDESGNMFIESRLSGENDKYRLLKAYTLLNESENTENENTEPTTTEPYTKVLLSDNPVINADEMAALVEENKSRDVIIDNGSGVTFTFDKGTMEMVDGKTEYDFGVIIITEYGKIDVTVPDWLNQGNFAALIHYNYSGKLPAKCTIRFNIGEEWAGKTLYYSYLQDGELSDTKEIVVDSRGYVTVSQTHCSDYLITAENPMKKTEIVKTGDNVNMNTYMILMIVTIGVLMLTIVVRKNKTSLKKRM